MYKLLIRNGSSFLFKDNGLDGIDNNDMLEFLINTDGIIDIIERLPIRKFYANTGDEVIELSHEDAIQVFNDIVETLKKRENTKVK